MGAQLIAGLVFAVLIAGGGAFAVKAIGDKEVAEYQASVKVEEEKIAAATATKIALEAKHIDELVDSFDAGEEVGRANRPKIAQRVKADTSREPAFRNADCTLPPQSFALYSATLSTLHRGDIPAAMLAIPPTATNTPAASKPPAPRPDPAPLTVPSVGSSAPGASSTLPRPTSADPAPTGAPASCPGRGMYNPITGKCRV